jgi:hypothetical protein
VKRIMLRRKSILLSICFSLMILSACNDECVKDLLGPNQLEDAASTPPSVPAIQPTPTYPPYPEADLNSIQSQIGTLLDVFQQKNSIEVMIWGTGQDHIDMSIRKFGDFEQPITQDEQLAFRQSLYKEIGKEFPLKLEISEFAPDSYMPGKIEEIEKDRVLIVNRLKKNGDTEDPEATYVGLTKDGKIYIHGNSVPQPFEKLAVGQEVRAWFTGMMFTSYPGQTSALKIEIMQ